MKALWKLTCAAVLGITLAACGGQDSGSGAQASAASSGSQPAAEAKREIRFGTTPGDFADMIKDQIQPRLSSITKARARLDGSLGMETVLPFFT